MAQDYHDPIPFGAPAEAATFNDPLGQLDAAITDLATGVDAFQAIALEIGSTLTLDASGQITLTDSVHPVDTFGGAASDNLDTILGGTEGKLLFLHTVSAARVVTIRTGVGNITLNGGNNISLSSPNQTIALIYHEGGWSDLAFGTQPATGTLVARTALGADATITISLAGTFTLAEVFLELRSDYSTNVYDDILVRFNADTTAANYENNTSYINNAGITTTDYIGTEQGLRFDRAAANDSSPAGYYSALVLRIFSYRDTSYYKFVQLEGHTAGDNTGANQYDNIGGGVWLDTDAITSITIAPVNGTAFKAGSAYMVKGY